jgi:hypothetical protein
MSRGVKRQSKLVHKSSGAALISALFISALAALLAIHMAYRQSMLINSVMQTSDQQQLLSYYQAMQSWAIDNLEKLTLQNKGVINILPEAVLNKNFGGWNFKVAISDQQGYYNINALTEQANIAPFATWVRSLDPALDYDKSVAIAQQVAEWVSDRSGVDDEYYANLNPGYRIAHQPMLDVSELNLIRVFNTKDQQLLLLKKRIQDLSAALPGNVQPNIWSIQPYALPAFMQAATNQPESSDSGFLQEFDSCRKQAIASGSVKDTTMLFQCLGIGQPGVNKLDLSQTQSNYFLISIRASQGNTIKYYTSLVHVALGDNNKVVTHVLWQRYFDGAN